MHVRASSWILLLGLCLGYILAAGVPASWGKHDGVLEGVQAVTLLAGGLVAVLAAYQQRGMAVGKIWWVAAMGWLGLLSHELAGHAGLVLPQAQVWLDAGPRLPSGGLPWPALAAAGAYAALLLAGVYWVLRYRLLSRVVVRWWHESAMPWGCVLVGMLALLLAAVAQGQVGLPMPQMPDTTRSVMVAMTECWVYAALWWAQWLLLHHMQDWRLSSYLQTMHFSRSSLGERFERRSI